MMKNKEGFRMERIVFEKFECEENESETDNSWREYYE
jgi:hypothetical protein